VRVDAWQGGAVVRLPTHRQKMQHAGRCRHVNMQQVWQRAASRRLRVMPRSACLMIRLIPLFAIHG